MCNGIFGQRDEVLPTTNFLGSRRLPEKFGKGLSASSLLTLKVAKPPEELHPDKFGTITFFCTITFWETLTIFVTFTYRIYYIFTFCTITVAFLLTYTR